MINLNKNEIKVGDIVYNDSNTETRLEVIWVGDIYATVQPVNSSKADFWDIMVDRLTKVDG